MPNFFLNIIIICKFTSFCGHYQSVTLPLTQCGPKLFTIYHSIKHSPQSSLKLMSDLLSCVQSVLVSPWLILLGNLLQQILEQELEIQRNEFDKLNRSAENIVEHLEENNKAVEDIQLVLDEFSQRWDSVVQQMEMHSKWVCLSLGPTC